MESKIEKIDHIDCITYRNRAILEEDITIVTEGTVSKILQKQNEIIDYLNSQAQPEEIDNTKLVMPPSAYEQAEKEGFDMRNKVKSELLPEDTPEEWEEELRDLVSKAQRKYSDFKRHEQMLSGSAEIYLKTRDYVEKEVVDDIVEKIKQLLDEREKEVRKSVLKEVREWLFSYLDKLNKEEK